MFILWFQGLACVTLKSSDEAKDFPHELRGAQVPAYAREAYVHRCSVLRSAFCVHGEKNFRKYKHKINTFCGSEKKISGK